MKAERVIRERARRKVINFCTFVDPSYIPARHLVYLAERLEQVERYIANGGKEGIGRLMVSLPPRYGKSMTVTKRFPAFILGNHPDWHIAMTAYGDELAADFSRAVRHLCAESRAYHQLFPTVNVHPQSSAVQRWSLENGDIDNPNVVATGIGGSLTGRGFQLVIIDDPIKSRAEAESPTYRRNVHESYRGTIRPRLEPGGGIICISTRWHEDDLQGWLLDELSKGEGEPWTVINIPAIAEENDVLGRQPGEALWPERFSLESLQQTAIAMGSYDFQSQYQGKPKPPEGGRIRRSWIEVIPELPARFISTGPGQPPAEKLRWYRYWDLALTTKASSDYTAAARIAFDNEGYLYIADMVRGKWEWPDAKRYIKETMLAEKSLGVMHGIEKALHGLSAVQEFIRDPDLRGVAFEGVDVKGDKLTRALPFIARAEAGKVRIISGAWVGAFLDEISNFTGAGDAHDDQVDTISGGILKLSAATSLSSFADHYKRKALGRVQDQESTAPSASDGTETTDLLNDFARHVELAAETGSLVTIPTGISPATAGNYIARQAAKYIDQRQDVKAIILLNERKRLGV